VEIVRRPPAFTIERLWHGLAALPAYWDLLIVLTRHRINVRYKQSLLGPAWALLQPLAMMVIFVAVFSVIARVPETGVPYAVFAYAGLLPWTAFSSALSTGAGSLVSHAALITRVAFPREILPVTYVAAAIFDLLVASVVLGAMLVYYGIPLTLHVLWVAPILLMLATVSTVMSLILSAVNVRYRDVGVAMPLLLQFWMFASPVLYPLESVPEAWRRWYLLNPMAGIVDGFRKVVLNGAPPDSAALTTAALVIAACLPLAYLWFKQVDATLADRV
jgi:lipopolysaccharide transport system permease protein